MSAGWTGVLLRRRSRGLIGRGGRFAGRTRLTRLGSAAGRFLVLGDRRLAGRRQLRGVCDHAFVASFRVPDYGATKLSCVGCAGFANRRTRGRSHRQGGRHHCENQDDVSQSKHCNPLLFASDKLDGFWKVPAVIERMIGEINCLRGLVQLACRGDGGHRRRFSIVGAMLRPL
jgi:hypothetical protein